MKKIFNYVLFAAAAFAATVSCSKETSPENGIQETVYPVYITAGKDLAGRTTLESDGSVFWKATDVVGVVSWDGTGSIWVNCSNTAGQCAIDDAGSYVPSAKATFVINKKKENYEPRYMIYPYYAGGNCETKNDRTGISINLPDVQTAVPGQVPDNTVTMMGIIDGNRCSMINACALVKFTIVGSKVTELSFYGNKGEIVAGRNYIYTDDASFSRTTGESKKTLTLKPESGVFEPGDYYFATWPNTFTEGFSIAVTNTDGVTAVKSTSKAITLSRNTVYTKFGSEQGWISSVVSGVAGDLGSADGTTATLYGIAPPSLGENDEIGFEISSNGIKWNKFEGEITKRITKTEKKDLNVFQASLTGLTPDTETFFRAYYKGEGKPAVCYGKAVSFKTVKEAESVNMNFYNCFDPVFWPLTSPAIGTGEGDIKKGTASDAIGKGVDLELVTSKGTFIAHNAGGVWCGASFENPTLVMGKAAGDYIKFPKVEGKAPVKVTFVVGNLANEDPSNSNNNMGRPSIVEFTTDGTASVAGGDQWNPLPCHINDIHVWNLDLTDASKQYGMYFNHATNRYIRYMEVIYAPVSKELKPITFDLVFSTRVGGDGGAENWPFEGTMGAYNNNPNLGPHHVSGYNDFTFTFHVQNLTAADCWRTTAGQGLRFGGTVGDYMAINAVEGYRLSHIKIRGGTQKSYYSVRDNSGAVITGGTETAINSTADSILEFDLTGTSLNTEYRLYIGKEGTSQQSAIRELWISYDIE